MDILQALRSGRAEHQVPALLQVKKNPSDDVLRAAAQAVVVSDDPFFVAERLPVLGTQLIPYVMEVREGVSDEDIRDLLALVLATLEYVPAYEWVREIIGTDRNHERWALRLWRTTVEPNSAACAYVERLRTVSLENSPVVAELLDGLDTYGVEVPNDIRIRISESSLPWEVKVLVDKDLPPPWPPSSDP